MLEDSTYHPSPEGVVYSDDSAADDPRSKHFTTLSPVHSDQHLFGNSKKTWGLELAEYSLSTGDETRGVDRENGATSQVLLPSGDLGHQRIHLHSPTVDFEIGQNENKYTMYERLSSTPARNVKSVPSTGEEGEFQALQPDGTSGTSIYATGAGSATGVVKSSELSQYQIDSQGTLHQPSKRLSRESHDESPGMESRTGELSQYTIGSATSKRLSHESHGESPGLESRMGELSQYTIGSVTSKRLSLESHDDSPGVESRTGELSQYTLGDITDVSHKMRDQLSPLSEYQLPGDSVSQSRLSIHDAQGSIHHLSQYPMSQDTTHRDTIHDSFGEMIENAQQFVRSLKPSHSQSPPGVNTMLPPSGQVLPPSGSVVPNMMTWHPSQVRTTTPEGLLLDISTSITDRIEGAMARYERLIEESRQTRQQYTWPSNNPPHTYPASTHSTRHSATPNLHEMVSVYNN